MSELADPTLALDIVRRFSASPARVFDAWLGNTWAEWLPPRGATCIITEADPNPGGRFHAKMTMETGREVNIKGQYLEIERPTRLVFTWHGDYCDVLSTVTLMFEPDGAGTLMTLHQVGFLDATFRANFSDGWDGPGGSFDKLAALVNAAA